MTTPQCMFVSAHAKINLTLDVLGRRDDGYHALNSLMQTLALHDTLRISLNANGDTAMFCDDPALQGDENVALRAARLLRAEVGDERLGATIELRKKVPVQAGLGGGSSDAAAVLGALNSVWGAGYPADHLEQLGARLGSDVPFFVRGGTALIAGRGEIVSPLPDAEPLWIVLAKPRSGISTALVFRQLTPANYSDGAATRQVVSAISSQRPIPFEQLFNALEVGVLSSYPEVGAVRDALLAAGAPVAILSGSGPTVFAPFRRLADAREVYNAVQHAAFDVWLTHTITALQSRATRPIPGVARSDV